MKCFLYFLIANVLLGLSLLPTIVRYRHTPPDRIATLVHGDWAQDYYLYLSVINQGANGKWLYTDPYTSEKTAPGIYYLNFILMGKIAGLFTKISPPVTYHLFNLLFAEGFIIAIYLLSKTILGNRQAIFASLISLTATVVPNFNYSVNLWHPSPPWWIIFYDALERLYTLPHYALSQLLFIFSVILLFKTIDKPKLPKLLLVIILLFASGITLPSPLLVYAFSLPAAYFTYVIIKKIRKSPKINSGLLISILLIFFSTILCYFTLKYQESLGFPWTQWSSYGLARWNLGEPEFDKTLFLAFGILPLLAIPAIIKIIIEGKIKLLLIVFWALMPFLILPFADVLKIPKIRLMQAAPYVPFSILATYTIFTVIPSYKRSVLRILIFLLFIVTTVPFSLFNLAQRINYLKEEPLYNFNYVPKNMYDSFIFLSQLPKDSVVLSSLGSGVMIPAFAPVKVYFGHQTQTKDYKTKELNVIRFYQQNKEDTEEMKSFLLHNKVNYVYFGTYEKEDGKVQVLNYPFLKVIYENNEVSVYSVI